MLTVNRNEQTFSLNPALEALYRALPGRVFTPTDLGYEAARAGYSLTGQPLPAVVVIAQKTADVVTAVRFAQEVGLPVGIHATGHNFPFPYEGGLMINTSGMQGLEINPFKRTVRVEAGVRWGAVLKAAQVHGLAALCGSSTEVGVVGYSLFGGIGWLVRKYGAAVDSVVAAEIVTADGQVRHVDAQHEPDLFWALRGGGGNFGVVTALELKLFPHSHVFGGNLFFAWTEAKTVLATYRAWLETLPEEMTSSVVLLNLPPDPALPPFLQSQRVVNVRLCYAGDTAEGAALLEPLRALEGLLADTCTTLPFSDLGTISNDPVTPAPSWRKTALLAHCDEALMDTLLTEFRADTALSVIELRHLGGALERGEATAFSQRYAPFVVQSIAIRTLERREAVEQDTAKLTKRLQPFATGGVLPGWLGDGDSGVARMQAGYNAANYQRLAATKQHYDPTNLFRLMHNIPPQR